MSKPRLLDGAAIAILIALGALLTSLPTPLSELRADDAPIELNVATYRQLGELVKQQRGKVVVIDMWATY
jgi:hypothetical protein